MEPFGFRLREVKIMNIVNESFLTTAQLAARWQIDSGTLMRWRSEGIGPRYLKLSGTVRYRIEDVDQMEGDCLRSSTSIK